ncbi:hypothetical protein [Streptomyces chartreusis]|uniref:hypothetical protein n=1 Tax=Streptomyces chartreusis TaxID=1969 RepID=UPI0037B94AE8
MKIATPVPSSGYAFDDHATRRAYERARRGTLIALLFRVAAWFALLVVAQAVETEEQLLEGAAAFLLVPASLLLIGPGRRLLWMISVGRVLRSHSWQQCGVTRCDGVRSDGGTPVQVQVFGADGAALSTSVMTARTWRMRRPQPSLLAEGAWFAGDLARGGVIAGPGGRVLMGVRSTSEPKLS